MEATATAVPSTAAGKQKYKWNDQTVEKLIDLYEEIKKIKKNRVNINEERQKLIAKCIGVLDKPKSPKRPLIEDPFALYVSHQLKGLDKTRRLIAEKK